MVADHSHKKDGQICAAFSIKKDKVLFLLKKLEKIYYFQQNINNNKNTHFYNQRNKNGAEKVKIK